MKKKTSHSANNKKKCKVIIFLKKTKAYSFEEKILDADQVSIFLEKK
jgi:hypothetical protein